MFNNRARAFLVLTAGTLALLSIAWQLTNASEAAKTFTISRDATGIEVKNPAGKPVLRYVIRRPEQSKLSVQSACYFHPVFPPNGVVLTDVAPDDHLHHRGVFLAWVEMHGRKDADFWGWGAHAPKDNRVIVNDSAETVTEELGRAELLFRNRWLAEGDKLVEEELRTTVSQQDKSYIIDLAYTITPDDDIKLARWAFSGFCFRGRKDGKLTATDPKGNVTHPNPSHVKPETDWPAADWYDFTVELADGKVAGMTVMDHPKNPPALWYNDRNARMLNPCIVAPSELVLKARKPLILRYRLVAHDGPAPAALLGQVAREWRK